MVTSKQLLPVYDEQAIYYLLPIFVCFFVDMCDTEKFDYYYATNEGGCGYISLYDFCMESYNRYGLITKVTQLVRRNIV